MLSSSASILSSVASWRISLWTGLCNSALDFHTWMLLTRPFLSGCTSETTPIGHSFLGAISSLISTTSLTLRLRFTRFHLGRSWRVGSMQVTSFCWNFPGGVRTMLVFMVRIRFGDRGTGSLQSLEITVSGLKLMIDSTSHMRVRKDSSSKQLPCLRINIIYISRIFCAVRICCSQTPPMSFAAGGLNFQSICC